MTSCVVSTNLLVATSADSCYRASMVNFILFTDETMFMVSALSNMGHKIRRLAIQKLNHLTSGACWCTVLLEGAKVELFPQVCESDSFEHFCGCNGKTSTACHQ